MINNEAKRILEGSVRKKSTCHLQLDFIILSFFFPLNEMKKSHMYYKMILYSQIKKITISIFLSLTIQCFPLISGSINHGFSSTNKLFLKKKGIMNHAIHLIILKLKFRIIKKKTEQPFE